MKQSFYEALQTEMYPSKLLHRYGVNGKISGSIYALSEIEGVIPIIHSPRGCGYHYRYSARRRMAPFFDICSTNMSEQDIIFSGEDKLYETILKVNASYNAKLIVVIPSPISDIIYDDIDGVVKKAQNQGVNVIGLASELFSHRDKTYSARRTKAFASQKLGFEKDIDFDIKGCGYTEAMCALVNHIMKPQEVLLRTVNIETIGWGNHGKDILEDIIDFLKGVDVTVNSFFPSTAYESIETLPRAALNLVKRIKWAKLMERKFGTPFMKVDVGRTYSGLKGIGQFYRDIGQKLDIIDEMEAHISRCLEQVKVEADSYIDHIKTLNGVIVLKSYVNAPYIISRYLEDYGMKIDYVCIFPLNKTKVNLEISEEDYQAFMQKIQDAIKHTGIKLFVSPSETEMEKITVKADYIVGTDDYSFEKYGLKVLHPRYEVMGLSFQSYLRSLKSISKQLSIVSNKQGLWLNKFHYNIESYPLIDHKDTTNTEKMWRIMWHQREK